ncbi:MAG TPA: peptide deformylase [Candidatus Binatia bacterium]|nr:peptide deformylase [Candidatus Binatia bacterium]
MPILEILRYPDTRLSKTSKTVKNIDGRVAGYLNSMVDTMYAANGIGLAAPQIGILENAIVVDVDPENRGKRLVKLINPQIVESSGEIVMEEGCLSVVNFTAEIGRARKILVRGWTSDQREVEIEAEELAAVCIQHEIDHLHGKLLTDHISRLKRELYRKRLKRMASKDDEGSERGSGPYI